MLNFAARVQLDKFKKNGLDAIAHGRCIVAYRFGDLSKTLFISSIYNIDRPGNFAFSTNYKRTGELDRTMDYMEQLAIDRRCVAVRVECIINEFLPSKLERRGYVLLSSGMFSSMELDIRKHLRESSNVSYCVQKTAAL